LFAELAEREGLPSAWTWREGETRVATIIVSEIGATVINEEGLPIQTEVWRRFQADVLAHTGKVDVICLSGSFPLGVTMDDAARLIRALVGAGKPAWIDNSGIALRAALETKGLNIKVNGDEIGATLNHPVTDLPSAVHVAAQVHQRTGGAVVVTLTTGAVMVSAEGCSASCRCRKPWQRRRSLAPRHNRATEAALCVPPGRERALRRRRTVQPAISRYSAGQRFGGVNAILGMKPLEKFCPEEG
jgi:fructose-1-phosphate kinase PfkB-like protein